MTLDPKRLDMVEIGALARLLRQGALVAFPTETVYGLGVNALDEAAVAEMYAAKGRPADNPLIVHVASVAQARALAAAWPEAADRLVERFWPGPLTIVVPRDPDVIPDIVAAGLDSVAIRVPSNPIALELLRLAAVPVAAPSANASGTVSPTTAEHVAATLDGRIDAIVDGGPCSVGLESTVVSLMTDPPQLLRPGGISVAQLREVLPGLVVGGEAGRSPGNAHRHYAPKTPVVIGDVEGPAVRIRRGPGDLGVIGMPMDAVGYGRALYAALHRADGLGVPVIAVEPVPEGPEWDAVRDRLQRAAKG